MSEDHKETWEPRKGPSYMDPDGFIELSDDDAACLALPDLDYDSQLIAIRGLLTRQGKADKELVTEIEKIEAFAARASGVRNQQAVDEWADHMHHSVYQDAAHSMAAVGMIAPFVESVFYQAFQNIGREMAKDISPPSNHARWKQSVEDQWDCNFVWTGGHRRKDLVKGIMQLVDAVDMTRYMPNDLEPTLSALFEYRNKMFHHGFEWPLEERRRFNKRLNESGWPPDWFSKATSDGKPWVFYMSSVFIEHCLVRTAQIITGIGGFCNQRFLDISPKARKDALAAIDELIGLNDEDGQ